MSPERLEERAFLLDSADLIIVDANIPENPIKWLAERYPKGKQGPLLGFDPVSVQKAARGADSLASFTFAKPNRAEAALLAGLEGSESPEPSVTRRASACPRLGRGLHLPRDGGFLGRG
jgi:hypothetical protein